MPVEAAVAQALRDASARWKAEGHAPAPAYTGPPIGPPMRVVIPSLPVSANRKGIVRTPSGVPLPGSVEYEPRRRRPR